LVHYTSLLWGTHSAQVNRTMKRVHSSRALQPLNATVTWVTSALQSLSSFFNYRTNKFFWKTGPRRLNEYFSGVSPCGVRPHKHPSNHPVKNPRAATLEVLKDSEEKGLWHYGEIWPPGYGGPKGLRIPCLRHLWSHLQEQKSRPLSIFAGLFRAIWVREPIFCRVELRFDPAKDSAKSGDPQWGRQTYYRPAKNKLINIKLIH